MTVHAPSHIRAQQYDNVHFLAGRRLMYFNGIASAPLFSLWG